MLQIIVPPPQTEEWDEINEEFIYRPKGKAHILQLEHSLISLSKWESKWHKSYISDEKTEEENLDYIKCMTLNSNVQSEIYENLTKENLKEIYKYINDPMTATTFSDRRNSKPNRRRVTSEVIYYWMIKLRIPVEFEKWHLQRLLTLIRVCEEEEAPKKKRSAKEIMSENAALNAARRKQFHSKG